MWLQIENKTPACYLLKLRKVMENAFFQTWNPVKQDLLLLMLLTLVLFQDDEETADFALDGLKQVMAVKSRSVLPYLVPKVSVTTVFSLNI